MQQMTKLREKAEAEREAANSKVQEKIAAVTKELVDSNSKFDNFSHKFILLYCI